MHFHVLLVGRHMIYLNAGRSCITFKGTVGIESNPQGVKSRGKSANWDVGELYIMMPKIGGRAPEVHPEDA